MEAVESAEIETAATNDLLQKYIQPFMDNKVDNVVLGCTHYPFLIDNMKKISGDKINYIDPAEAVVKQVERMLNKYDIGNEEENTAHHVLYSSGSNFPVKKLLPTLDYSKIKIVVNSRSQHTNNPSDN